MYFPNIESHVTVDSAAVVSWLRSPRVIACESALVLLRALCIIQTPENPTPFFQPESSNTKISSNGFRQQ